MTPALQQILHEITVRLTKLEKSFLQPEQDCTRSHPHEEMNKECELRTEIARLRNQLAQRTWVGLTKDQMLEILREIDPETQRLPIGFRMFADAIEAKLKEKNT